MNKILVTGGSGFLGFSLVKKLLEKNYNVVVYDNNFRGNFKKFQTNNFKKITLIKGDIRDEEKLNKAVKKCNTIIHLAFINGTKNFYLKPKLVLDVGVDGTIKILKASLKSNKVKRFIYASSSEVYHKPKKIPANEKEFLTIPDPHNPRFSYSSAKIIGEILTLNLLRNSKIIHNIFRPHNIFGQQMGFEHVIPDLIKKIYLASSEFKKKNCSLKIQGSGNETRSFCFIDDAVTQIINISLKGKNKEIYNIGQKNEISIKKLINDISKILKIKIKINVGKLLQGSVKRRCPDIQKITKLGKFNNTYYKGLEKTVIWYKKYYLNKKFKSN